MPALLLNYYGQGALLLRDAAALDNPFYRLVPSWGLYPLVVLAAAATIIASQAVISGAFSITRQAIQLGYLPRLRVLHTSEQEIGQVYVPRINTGLFVAIVVLVIGFQTSDNLGAAYGIAVTGMMVITSGLAFIYMRSIGWSLAARGRRVRLLPDRRSRFSQRQSAEDRAGRLVPDSGRGAGVRGHVDMVARPPDTRRKAGPRDDAARRILSRR